MFKNDSIFRMLLCSLAFLMISCSSYRKSNTSGTAPNRQTSVKSPVSQQKLRLDIANYAKSLVGKKYKYAGMSPAGFDCSGLTSYIYQKYRNPIPRSSTAQAAIGKKIPLSKASPGDLLFFNKGNGAKVNHVALVVSNQSGRLNVVHSTTSKGVIIQDINKSTYWKPRLMFARDVISK